MRPALPLAVALTLVVGCADGGSSGGATTAPAAPAAAGTTPAPAGAATTACATPTAGSQPVAAPAALQFTAPLVGGGTLNLASYAGTTVALWFWAPT